MSCAERARRDGRGGGGDGRRDGSSSRVSSLHVKVESFAPAAPPSAIVRVTTIPPTTRPTDKRTNHGSTVFDFLTLTFLV